MQVKILLAGPYADFDTRPGYTLAKQLRAGDVVDYPSEYARSLIESGLAEDAATVAVKQITQSARAELPEAPPPVPDEKAQGQGEKKGRKR